MRPEGAHPATGGRLGCQLGGDGREHTAANHDHQPRHARIDRVCTVLANALHVLPAAGEPGYPTPDRLAIGLAAVLRAWLGSSELLTLASAAMMALDADTAEQVAEATFHDIRAGEPVPHFDGVRAEARYWATFATRGELRAYMAACWHRLPEADRAGFLRAVRPAKRRAAA